VVSVLLSGRGQGLVWTEAVNVTDWRHFLFSRHRREAKARRNYYKEIKPKVVIKNFNWEADTKWVGGTPSLQHGKLSKTIYDTFWSPTFKSSSGERAMKKGGFLTIAL
jgi:hypothetical protein